MGLERSKFHDSESGAETSHGMSCLMADHTGHDQVVIYLSQDSISAAPDTGADENQKKRKDKKSPNEKEKLPE